MDFGTDAISGYRTFQAEGDSYLKAAYGALKRPQVFTPEIRFNLLGMAIEKHLMAILMQSGDLPDNHTFHDLTHAMAKVAPLDPADVAFLHRMDDMADLCSLAATKRRAPDEASLERLLTIAQAARDHADGLLGPMGAMETAAA
jgi:hypothetical protein